MSFWESTFDVLTWPFDLTDGGGGPTIEAPKPSPEELALQREQLRMLQLQREETEAMKPWVLRGMGLIEEEGELRKMTEEERTAGMGVLELGQYELTKQAQERQRKAYAGELPISPALEKSLTDQEAQLAEALSQRLGPNWMLTTPGQQAMGEFKKRTSLLREEARRGAITTGGGLLLSNLGYLADVRGRRTGEAIRFPSRTGGLFTGYGQLQDPYRRQREMEYGASIYGAQMGAQRRAGLMSGIGQLFGAGAQAYGAYAGLKGLGLAAAASSKILKENIEIMTSPIEKIEAIRGVDFDWKAGGHDVGVIAEEIEKVIPEAVIEIDGLKYVFYHKIIPLLVEAIKEQQRQISALEVSHA